MNIRSKTKKRLLILLVILIVIGAGSASFISWRMSENAKALALDRENGMKAAAEGDHVKALNLLSRYLRYHKNDVPALYEYAIARREIPAPQGKNILEAMGLFRAVLEAQPDHVKAQKDLLQLYSIVRYNTEAMDLADKMLAKDPKNPEILRYKAFSLVQLRKFEEGLKVTLQAVELEPENLQGQMMVLEVMRQLDRPPAELIQYAQDLQKARPDDPRFTMLLGYAHVLTNNYIPARDTLLAAAKLQAKQMDSPEYKADADFVRVLTIQLDQLGQFQESMDTLKRNVDKSRDPALARLLVRRYWELFRYDEMLSLLEHIDLQNPKSHSELMAFKAMAFIRTGRTDDAKKVMDMMTKRGDPPARAWVAVLKEVVMPITQDVKKVIEVCQLALTADPANPYIRFFLGEAFYQMGEVELALDQWKTSVEFRRGGSSTWALPHVRIAQALMATGRTKSAYESAMKAVQRAPSNSAAISALANAQSVLLDESNRSDKQDELLALLSQIQNASPGEPQTLPLYIELLSRAQRNDEALMAIYDVLAIAGQFPKFDLDVEKAYKALDKDSDTFLTADEYEDALNEGYFETLKRRFDAADKAKRGKLAIAEFQTLYPGERDDVPGAPAAPADQPKTDGPLTRHFKAADADKDGFVSLDEWRDDLRRHRFTRLDVDRDGKLSGAEFKGAAAPEALLLRLAAISRDALGVDELLYQATEKRWGMTANLAFALALEQAQKKGNDVGKAFFKDLYDKNDRQKDLTWQLAWAQLLSQVEDPTAAQLWVSLADKNADNMAVQRRVLMIPSVQSDRAFMDRVIERVKNLGGEQGLTWKLARARWLISSDEGQKDASKAVVILNDVVRNSPDLIEPRLLLAAALQKVDNTAGAVEQLTAAYNLQPRNMTIVLALARLRLAQGDFVQTRRLLEQVKAEPDASDAMLRQVAAMQTQMGDNDEAVKLLSDAQARKQGEPDLMLAELYFRTNQREKAEQIYRKLMEKPTLQLVQSYSNFLGTADRIEEAQSVLRAMDKLEADAGVREMIRADFNRRFVSTEAAAREFEAAIKAVPHKAPPYQHLISMYLERGKVNEALEVNSRAAKAVTEVRTFSLLEQNTELLKSVAVKPQLQRLVQSAVNDNEYREAALEILRAIDKAAKDKEPVMPTLARLKALTDKYPRFLAMQILMVDLYAGAGRLEDAANLASRTMQTFPNNPEPAEQATRVLAAMRRWNEVLTSATAWRERSLTRPLAADIAIAEAYINTAEPQKALQQVAKYRTAALADPNNFFGVISVNVRALAVATRYDEAANLLKPMLTGPQGWRDFWQLVAMQWIRDPKIAAAWLERVQPVIPKDAQDEFHTLANNWYTLGKRVNSQDFKNRGIEMIRELAKRSDALPGPIIGYAILAYQEKDLATAEAQYRRALEKKGDHPVALNNLAMLIVERNGDLDEALKLAKRTVELEPNTANYYDTIATVQSKRKEYAAAVESLRQALQIQPGSIEWRINMAQAQLDMGKKDEAQAVIREIETLQPRLDTLPPDQQKRIRDIKASVADKAAAVQ